MLVAILIMGGVTRMSEDTQCLQFEQLKCEVEAEQESLEAGNATNLQVKLVGCFYHLVFGVSKIY